MRVTICRPKQTGLQPSRHNYVWKRFTCVCKAFKGALMGVRERCLDRRVKGGLFRENIVKQMSIKKTEVQIFLFL